jgi:hypothetical protein
VGAEGTIFESTEKSMTKLGSIVFPWGGGGNHLRWLLFLDKKFTTSLCDNNLESKSKFVHDNVYNSQRTWNNWLSLEWQHKVSLNDVILLAHDNYNWKLTETKELYLNFSNPELPLQHYYHINLGLNSLTPEEIKKNSSSWSQEFTFLQRRINEFSNKKIIKADKLYEKNLDYHLYKEIVDFFVLDDLYEHALVVHDWYYQCRIKSAKDFYDYFTGSEFKNYLNIMKEIEDQ